MKQHTSLLVKQIDITEKKFRPTAYVSEWPPEMQKFLKLLKTYVKMIDKKVYKKEKNGKAQ